METKRLDSLARSYVYTAFSEQLGGMACIRSHRQEATFIKSFHRATDIENRLDHMQTVLIRWLSLRVTTYGNIMLLAIGLTAVGLRHSVPPAKIGIVSPGLISSDPRIRARSFSALLF